MKGLLLLLALAGVACADYYELLGVSKDATNLDLRRAFKKIALEKHPDKRKDDPNAHDEFIKINTAYEVLKDPELRKKYDEYGEEGLKEGFRGGQEYESWQHFRDDFGLYDDDPQIEKLGEPDFWSTVVHSEDWWFVNFYATGCSHCHELAPDWRKLGTDLQGMMGIGAVNCREQWNLCANVGIQSYPTLLFFHASGRYDPYEGVRELNAMKEWALGRFPNVQSITKLDQISRNQNSILIICAVDDLNCISQSELKEVSLLNGKSIATYSLECSNAKKLCKNENWSSSHVRFFQTGQTGSGKQIYPVEETEHWHVDTREIVALSIASLPDLRDLSDKMLDDLLDNHRRLKQEHAGSGLFVVFIENKSSESKEAVRELRKLNGLPDSVSVAVHKCESECKTRHRFHKLPIAKLFKTDGYQTYHGKFRIGDVTTWIKSCMEGLVIELNDDDFPTVTNSEQLWMVDFFAPWCPPCRAMQPSFRQASIMLKGQVRLGTVDCVEFPVLCQSLHIQSYPSVILYNGSDPTPHQFAGDGTNPQNLVDHVETVKSNPVTVLTPELYQSLIMETNDMWMVDFFAPWCGHCMHMAPHYAKAAKLMKKIAKFGSVDCQKYQDFCAQNGIRGYPTVYFYARNKKRKVLFQDQPFTEQIANFVRMQLKNKLVDFTPNQHQSDIATRKVSWLLVFGAPWCGPCNFYYPSHNQVALLLSKAGSDVQVGKVNCQQFQEFCQRMQIPNYPNIRLYENGHVHEAPSRDPDDVVAWTLQKVPPKQNLLHDEF